ncbi:MAG: hypothetical protein ABIE07_08315 [Candidatus Zixiibacteriota bacterium]
MSTKELQQSIIENMRKWQKVEDASIEQCNEIITKTKNPVIKMAMEIIRNDSMNHHRVQELIASSLEADTMSLSPDDIADVWDLIQRHIDMEKKAEAYATEAHDALKGKKMVIQEYLLNYLLVDEKKHDMLLDTLETIKKGMYPYG